MDGVIKGLAAGTVIVGVGAQAWLHLVGPTAPDERSQPVPLAAMIEATVPVPCGQFLEAGGVLQIQLSPEAGGPPGKPERISLSGGTPGCTLNGRYDHFSLVLKACNTDTVHLYAWGVDSYLQGEGRCTADKATGRLAFFDAAGRRHPYRFTISRI